ncbi:MAG: hypothetical protein JWO94_405 [Verrucomicrobiaceae bacterium]|nr:hypothetical protein [Verrucomicrobiaceae bacterium]
MSIIIADRKAVLALSIIIADRKAAAQAIWVSSITSSSGADRRDGKASDNRAVKTLARRAIISAADRKAVVLALSTISADLKVVGRAILASSIMSSSGAARKAVKVSDNRVVKDLARRAIISAADRKAVVLALSTIIADRKAAARAIWVSNITSSSGADRRAAKVPDNRVVKTLVRKAITNAVNRRVAVLALSIIMADRKVVARTIWVSSITGSHGAVSRSTADHPPAFAAAPKESVAMSTVAARQIIRRAQG